VVSQLADMMERQREEIAQRWADQLYAVGVPESVKREDVIDNMREFLSELVEGLRTEQGFHQHSTTLEQSALAKGHGKQRFHTGYDLGAVIREYGSLRDLLFQLVEESGLQPSVRELRVLSKHLVAGIADAASQYGLERDEELRQRSAQHISFLAHELRNPLSSVRLGVELLRRKGQLPHDKALERVEQGLKRLGDLIDQSLLEMRSKAIPEPQRESVDLDTFLQGIAAESVAEVEVKHLRLQVEVTPDTCLQADPKLLRSAISNLVRNAVKFTHEGGTIHLRAKKNTTRLVVEVEDECGGLPEGRLQGLFDPFVQVGQDRSGFGLGLAIAKQAAEAHGGELRVHNLPGKGCVFVLDLPVNPVPPIER
jgi:signal transduction histidine kinase